MGERGVRNAEVEGSIPFSSTNFSSFDVPSKRGTEPAIPTLSINYKPLQLG
jgi:hypothetical protein